MNSGKTHRFPISLLLVFLILFHLQALSQQGVRSDILLNSDWRTVANDTDQHAFSSFNKPAFDDSKWKKVEVPHNWDQYEGYRRMKHGNRHGYAWYRKPFTVKNQGANRRYFLWFEGVSSYATVWLNGLLIGEHKGGRTSFTLDITNTVRFNKPNILSVRADHPAMIKDLPWVCGGCSDDRGFSEGSQPMGIFRPVHLVVTGAVRVEPFGVHIWNDDQLTARQASLHLETELKNYADQPRTIVVTNTLTDRQGKQVAIIKNAIQIAAGTDTILRQKDLQVAEPHLWSLEDPYLYTLVSDITEGGKMIDHTTTSYGIRWISWPVTNNKATGSQFFLNGKPVFINGTAEYEHLMGRSQAFTPAQVRATVMQVRAAGFNAFRDAHQPHNLLFQHYWDELGILWWPQFSAHDWYDTPEFRTNFKTLLVEWVKERRNNPSNILWGLQNESKLPEDFARECTSLIRQLDPTASSMRKVTTCNGGSGTDWDVPQNWTGTYGGDPLTYADDIRRQLLIGEYGAWRSLDLHTEGNFKLNGPLSEDRMTQLMETKIRLAESVRDACCGQFHWLLSSHENPGRIQGGEGFRELDRVGPVNYKGLFTPWGEPTDAYYMFRANYAPKDKEPMAYIVSHTWPDRWIAAGTKDSIIVYSNCEEVELFNDIGAHSLGRRTRKGIGTHFQWDHVPVLYNVLYAEGRVAGKVVTRDTIVLSHLPAAPHFDRLVSDNPSLTAPRAGYHYLYRVNCGGPEYTDKNGNTWMADRKKTAPGTWGSLSWTADFDNMTDFFASQRTTKDPVAGTADWPLFQSFRFGMDKLRYAFPVADGDYQVELYFVEPWYGTGGGMDCSGWRLFDIAINDKVVEKNLDIWKQAGHNRALKKTYSVHAIGGQLLISFPQAAAGEAIIAAITIASKDPALQPAAGSPTLVQHFRMTDKKTASWQAKTWLNTGDKQYADRSVTFSSLPPELYGAEWISTAAGSVSSDSCLASFDAGSRADVYIGLDTTITTKPRWMDQYTAIHKTVETDHPGPHTFHLYSRRVDAGAPVCLGANGRSSSPDLSMYTVFVLPVTDMEPAYDLKPTTRYEAEAARLTGVSVADSLFAGKKYVSFTTPSGGSVEWNISIGAADAYALRFRYFIRSGKSRSVKIQLLAADGTVMKQELATLPATSEKWATFDSSTGTNINAGNYKVIITSVDPGDLWMDYLEVQ